MTHFESLFICCQSTNFFFIAAHKRTRYLNKSSSLPKKSDEHLSLNAHLHKLNRREQIRLLGNTVITFLVLAWKQHWETLVTITKLSRKQHFENCCYELLTEIKIYQTGFLWFFTKCLKIILNKPRSIYHPRYNTMGRMTIWCQGWSSEITCRVLHKCWYG